MANLPQHLLFEVVRKPHSEFVTIRMRCNESGYTDRVVMMKKYANDTRIRDVKKGMKQCYNIKRILRMAKLV